MIPAPVSLLIDDVAARPLTDAQLGLRRGDPVWFYAGSHRGGNWATTVWGDGPFRVQPDGPWAVTLTDFPGIAWLFLVTPREAVPIRDGRVVGHAG